MSVKQLDTAMSLPERPTTVGVALGSQHIARMEDRLGIAQGEIASVATLPPSADQLPDSTNYESFESVTIPPEALQEDAPAHYIFLASRKWEGAVISIEDETFHARLVDMSEQAEDEEAEFPISDVSDDDRALLQEGANFYFSVGYLVSESGSRQRCARMRFRRMPKWSPDEIIEAHARAKGLRSRLKLE